VLERLPQLKAAGNEYWLVFQGGLNSVGTPERTNHDIREMFVLAHSKGFKVVGFTLTPWGDESDKRWAGTAGLRYLRATTRVVDFVLGTLTPAEALGEFAGRRAAGAAAGPGRRRSKRTLRSTCIVRRCGLRSGLCETWRRWSGR
jgi:hypothetical protein